MDFAKLDPADYAAEWKWDGIRIQAVSEGGVRRLYSRTGDDISGAFPGCWSRPWTSTGCWTANCWCCATAVWPPFGDLQQRLNRKTIDAKLMAAQPAGIRAYDLLVEHGQDIRHLSFPRAAVQRLEAFVGHDPIAGRIDLSPMQPFETWEALAALRADAARRRSPARPKA